MYERYHIHAATVTPRYTPVPKFLIARADNCINCGKCERNCVYGVHERRDDDPRIMADPISQQCKNCFRCVAECPQRALTLSLNQDYLALGNGVWTPQRVLTVWNESEMGKIPVLGAGYRGMFSGPGYDAMWTDMSEIVRPTRDGIHGREHISTNVVICRNPPYLQFGPRGELLTTMASCADLPVPFVLDVSRLKEATPAMLKGYAQAAGELNTLFIFPVQGMAGLSQDIPESNMVPIIMTAQELASVPAGVRMIEIERDEGWDEVARTVRSQRPGIIIGVRLQTGPGIEERLLQASKEADVIHILLDQNGRDTEGRYARDAMRDLHRSLVKAGVRDEVTMIMGGGIAAAEHIPKSIICGADAVTLEEALMVSIGCRACKDCRMEECPANVKDSPSDYVKGRTINMCNAWRDQMLEVLGAMGIKEVRRLRGEVGRAIFQEDAERDSFAGMFGGDASG